ncbi:MAG: thioredoxin domain-containing protein [Armatimonadetes bacterium]|nr:thioredoxin domain-containing protein [Armatimonadota bacterium]
MQNPRFTVVTSCVVALSLIGAASHLLAPLLPKENYNALQYEPTAFLKKGGAQMVRWRLMGQEAFAEARRTGKPILLFVGVPWSDPSKAADREFFSDRDAVSYLNNHFVCIRVDGEQDPTWISTYFPVSRMSLGILAGLQLWLLEPEGSMIESAGAFGTVVSISPESFNSSILRLQGDFDKVRTKDPSAPNQSSLHAQDIELLTTPSAGEPPNFAIQGQTLASWPRSPFGGFRIADRIEPMAGPFRYLLRSGAHQELRQRLDPLIRSPLVDWLDGGFFASIDSRLPPAVDFDKVAVPNADMMALLAQAALVLEDPVYREVAVKTFDSLVDEFQNDGLISSCRLSSPERMGRSKRASFSPQVMRDVLSPEDREWARTQLGLRVEENPAMCLWLKRPEEVLSQRERFESVRSKLLSGNADEREYGSSTLLDVNGFVIARLLECARLWNDPRRLEVAQKLFERLEWFRSGDDVKHSSDPNVRASAYLGDYLAYSEAALQSYFASGDSEAFNLGLRVLQRAQFLFGSDVPGVWNTRIKAPTQPGPKNVMAPEVVDAFRDSLTSKAITLLNAYGRLIRDPGAESRQDRMDVSARLSQESISMVLQFGRLSERLALIGSAYFSASIGVLDDRYAVAVGPHSTDLACALSRKIPTRLCAPATGLVRRDLQKRKPGVYVIRGSSIAGPLTVDEAAVMLSPQFTLPDQ